MNLNKLIDYKLQDMMYIPNKDWLNTKANWKTERSNPKQGLYTEKNTKSGKVIELRFSYDYTSKFFNDFTNKENICFFKERDDFPDAVILFDEKECVKDLIYTNFDSKTFLPKLYEISFNEQDGSILALKRRSRNAKLLNGKHLFNNGIKIIKDEKTHKANKEDSDYSEIDRLTERAFETLNLLGISEKYLKRITER